ncbi:MAG: hypothetical protein NC432_05275 [Roseburia sp.]|nr:hypothetical protein [Roseburia sp.]MCM1097919.1 hypothetical protein [Ruminococcus flavefaciens]
MKRKKKWMRMLAATALAVVLALPLSAMADVTHETLKTNEPCSLKVTAPVINDSDPVLWEKQLNAIDWSAVSVELYRVADVEKTAGYDDYDYKSAVAADATDPFADIVTAANEYIRSETAKTAEQWDALARQAAETVRKSWTSESANRINAAYTDNVANEVTDITAGLYLLLIRDPGSDFKMVGDNVVTVVRTANYEFEFAPALVSLPIHQETTDAAGAYNGYVWNYSPSVTPKYGIAYRYGSLEIVKNLLTYQGDEPATFVFQVESSYTDGRAAADFNYSNVVTLSFDANSPASQTIRLENAFPMGAQVTVTEIYSGSTYALTAGDDGERTLTLTESPATTDAAGNIVIPADTVRAEFTNDYNSSGNNGGAVVNSFTTDGSTWTWEQISRDANGQMNVTASGTAPVTQTQPTTPEPSVEPEAGN